MKEEKLYTEGWRKFLHLLKKSKNLDDLFKILLTDEEKNDLAKRTLIVEALIKGEKTQREISKNLKVSISKITRGSNELKNTNESFIKFLKILF